MRHINTLLLFLFLTSLHSSFGQIKPMGFTQKIKNPASNRFYIKYRPKMQVINDTLFVCSNTGIYRKDMQRDTEFELHAFANTPITEFVKKKDSLLAISTGTIEGRDSLILLSKDNGKTFENFTSSHLFEFEEYNYPYRIRQNPDNPNSLLLFHACYGLSKSEDFGKSWKNLNDIIGGYQDWFAGFHPADTTLLFYSGELPYFAGYIYRSTDNGVTWTDYTVPYIDNCIHHIAFHPKNPDILIYSAELAMGKSTDKGETWTHKDLDDSHMYFYKVLFDENNPSVLYASGIDRQHIENDTIRVFRSVDTGETWQLAYNEDVGKNCGGVYDMIQYKNKLIFYTRDCGLFELELENIPGLSIPVIEDRLELTIYPNPVSNTLHFDTNKVINRIEITDVAGRLVQQTDIEQGKKVVDVSPLNSGDYIIVFYSTNKEKITKKICISN